VWIEPPEYHFLSLIGVDGVATVDQGISLSIVIPSFNHRDFIEECLDAVIAIPVDSKEIIIIDDGSTDGSQQIIERWVVANRAGHRIHCILRENRGLVATLNDGLNQATGEFFYLVASDDVPLGDGLLLLMRQLAARPSQHFAIGNAVVFWPGESHRPALPGQPMD